MLEEVQIELSKFAKQIIKESRRNLTRKGKNFSRDLYNSLSYDLDVHRNSFSLSFYMADYGAFVDEGVRGNKSSQRAPQSPYRFGTGTGKKGGLTKGIDKWVRGKGIQFRKKDGKFMSYSSTAFLIRRSIWNKGIKPSMFFTRPFENAFKNLPDELIEKFGLDIDELIESTLNA